MILNWDNGTGRSDTLANELGYGSAKAVAEKARDDVYRGRQDMLFTVTKDNNFCRIYALPKVLSHGYCFGGHIEQTFAMVDWLNPVHIFPPESNAMHTKYPVTISLQLLHDNLIDFLLAKPYVKLGVMYLVLCDFGAAFTFSKAE